MSPIASTAAIAPPTPPEIKEEVVTVPLLPKQIDFLQSDARELLFSGAFGAGKSRVLCWLLTMRASTPGAVEILCRKHNVTLKRTTLRTLLRPDGDLPPVLMPGTYKHNKSEQRIEIIGGGEIMYFGLDDPEKIGSTPASGVAVDEAVELDEDDWRALRGRIRVKVNGLDNKLYGACNPGPPTHHLATRFGLISGKKPYDNCEAISTHTQENFFLPKEYVDDLLTFTGVALQRYVEGLWVAAEGLVFPDLLDCFIPHQKSPHGYNVGGVDFGWRNPFCALGATIYPAEGGKPVIYVWYEDYAAEVPIQEHAVHMNRAFPDGDAVWYCDPEDPEAARDLRKYECMAKKAYNKILFGIDAVNGYITNDQLFISDMCLNTRNEAGVYCYNQKDEKEKPVDKFNHAMSALRYMCAAIKKYNLMEMVG